VVPEISPAERVPLWKVPAAVEAEATGVILTMLEYTLKVPVADSLVVKLKSTEVDPIITFTFDITGVVVSATGAASVENDPARVVVTFPEPSTATIT
jgi:hypothetical protein